MPEGTNRKKELRVWTLPRQGLAEPLMVLGAAFLLGAAAGSFAAYHMGSTGVTTLQTYLSGYLAVLRDGEQKSDWGALLWRAVRFPAVVALLGLCPLGFPAIPVAVCIRGFLFSFVVSACGSCAGAEGVLAALLLFGLAQAVSTAAMLLIGIPGWGNARNLALAQGRKRTTFPLKRYLLWCAGWLALVLLATVLCHFVSCAAAGLAVEWLS